MTTKKRCSGFTLAELMMAMLAMSILLLATGSILVYSWMGWRRTMESVNMQRDAVIAMEEIARGIRSSNISQISADADGIYFSSSSVETDDIAISKGVNIRNFQVTSVSNAVVVGFTLFTSDNVDQNTYRMLVNTRN